MKIYIINDWVEFPASEYGGLIVLAASDDDEAERMCHELDGGCATHAQRIRPAVRRAERFDVASSVPPGVVEVFRT